MEGDKFAGMVQAGGNGSLRSEAFYWLMVAEQTGCFMIDSF